MIHAKKLILIASAFVLAGCAGEAAMTPTPDPIALTAEAAGHYCQMIILDHEGPKAQMFLAGMANPLWFSQVRDGLAYVKSPEQSAEIVVMYVNDMGKAKNWSEPGEDNWIRADEAFYVVGSDALGGMGAPELVPFAEEDAALAFANLRGGEVRHLQDITQDHVLAPVDHDETNEEVSQ